MDFGLSARDLALFVRCYSGTALRAALTKNAPFWRSVCRRAETLYRKCNRAEPRLRLTWHGVHGVSPC